jgi:hypothetical protein
MIDMKVLKLSDGSLAWHCIGCNDLHTVNTSWQFNGDYDKPTFSPSVLVRSGHYASGKTDSCWCTYNAQRPDKPATFKCRVCHTFIRDGKIQYLSDCTHEYAGKTVDMVDIQK